MDLIPIDKGRRKMKDYRYRNSKWLIRKYYVDMLSERKIAEECGVAGSTIHKWLKTHKIYRRDRSEAMLLRDDWRSDFNTHLANITYRDRKWLKEKRLEEYLSVKEIANELGASRSTIEHWLKRFDIPADETKVKEIFIRIEVKMPKFLRANLNEYCRKKNISRSRFIRELLIEEMLKEQEEKKKSQH